jgi:flagellar biosynthesis/type III secretory pathway protein FliH
LPDTAVATRVLKAADVRTSPVVALLGTDQEEEARRQAQAELDAAVADAYRRGVADGRDAAEREGAGAVPRLVDAVAAAADGAATAAAAQVRADASSLLALAAEMAAWMVGEQAAADAAVLAARLEAALVGLAPTASLEIEVAPAQVDAIAAWAGSGATVVGNPSLGPGDALLRAGAASADLRLAEAVRRALSAFEGRDDG